MKTQDLQVIREAVESARQFLFDLHLMNENPTSIAETTRTAGRFAEEVMRDSNIDRVMQLSLSRPKEALAFLLALSWVLGEIEAGTKMPAKLAPVTSEMLHTAAYAVARWEFSSTRKRPFVTALTPES